MVKIHKWQKRTGILLMLGLVVMMLMPMSALANTYGTVRNPNGGSYVNVRAWPTYDSDILTRLAVGSTVEITGTTGTWYSVWVDGVVGYMHSNFVSVSGGGESGDTATVRSGPLNMREAPTMRARVIQQLPTGMRVQVLAQDGTWTQVQTGSILGYVVTSYLDFGSSGGTTPPKQPVDTPGANATIRTTNGGNLNLRVSASSSSGVVDSYANGSRVRIISRGDSWSYVQVSNRYGYMATMYLVSDGGSGSVGYDAVVNNPGAGQVLNLREQPSTTARSLGQYRNGTSLKVLGVGTEWLRVNVGGTEGYMMTKYVRILSSSATPNKTVRGGSAGYVNLRSGPGYDYGILRQVTNGSAATIEIPYPVWSKVIVRNGSGYLEGYMMNSFLK